MSQLLADLQFWRGFHWRRAVLMITLAGLEVAWLTPILMALHPRSWDKSPFFYLIGLWAVMLLMMAIAYFMSTRQIDSPMFELGVIAAIVVIGLVIARLYIFWDAPAFDLSWLGSPFQSANPRRFEVFLLLAALGYLWWRGVTFLQREIGFFIIGYDFRKGVLGLVVGVLLFSALSNQPADAFVYPFFFFSLMAVALGRVEDKALTASGGEQPSGPEWVGIIALCSGIVLGIAALFSQLWSLNGFKSAWQIVAPTGSVLGQGLEIILVFILRLLNPFLEWLMRIIRQSLPDQVTPIGLDTPPDIGEILGADAAGEVGAASAPPWLDFVGDYLLPAAIMIGALILLVFWLERRRRGGRETGRRDLHERTDGSERAGVGGLLQEGLDRVREWMGLIGQFGLGRRFYAAISIRNIYANLQHLARDRGYPRGRAQTPNDYLPALQRAFPGQDPALARITEAYNAFEYGEVPTSPAELEQLQQAWASLQEAAKQTEPLPRAAEEQP